MPAKWLSNSSDVTRRAADALEEAFRFFSEPTRARRLRQGLSLLFALWAVLALSQLIWALLPGVEGSVPANTAVINPVTLPAPAGDAAPVNVARLQAWHLFGEAGASPSTAAVETAEAAAAANARDGIEKGARETRLALKLRGVVASTEDGLGYAIIEHNSTQEIYAVEDKLPVPGRVVLAKVMPRQVVLDNGGTYELLELFEDSALDTQLAAPVATPGSPQPPAMRSDATASSLARSYRDRLYQNPQSLADVVTVSAVRENGALVGYRLAPGKEREQFETLGFRSGDLVTSVNGLALDDPANTLRLYQAMRGADEAVFGLRRDGQEMTLSVNLADAAQGQ